MNTVKLLPLYLLSVALSLPHSSLAASDDTKQESPKEYLYSSALTTKVHAKLIADSDIKSLPITVNSYKNKVQLCGFVDSKEQEDRAVSLAKQVNGVEVVVDSLLVR